MNGQQSQPPLLRFRFGPFRSPRMAIMLEAARAGQYQAPAHPHGWHETSFALRTRDDVQQALTLTENLFLHPCAEAYANGHRINLYNVKSVLKCYEKSFGPSDWRAHCWLPKPAQFYEDRCVTAGRPIGIHMTVDGPPQPLSIEPFPQDPEPIEPPHRVWLMPCRIPAGSDISRLHPAPLRAQVEAALIQYECAWCPRLRHLDDWDLHQWDWSNAPAEPF